MIFSISRTSTPLWNYDMPGSPHALAVRDESVTHDKYDWTQNKGLYKIEISDLDAFIKTIKEFGGSVVLDAADDEIPHIEIYDNYRE